MRSIRTIIPRPTPVLLGGGLYLASELRLEDLADLQAWVDSTRPPGPYEAACEAIALGAPGRTLEWKRLLAATVEAQDAWPRDLGTPDADAALASRDGRIRLIGLALAREHPTLSGRDLARIFGAMTAGEFGRLSRVAWGNEPMRDLMALVEGDGDGPGGGTIDWATAWAQYGAEFRGPPFEQLTITQFLTWRRGGGYSAKIDGSNPYWREIAARRAAFWSGLAKGGEVSAT